MSKGTRYKRRNYFINKEFQGRSIFNYFILLALGSILFVGIFSFFSSNTLSIVYENYHLQLGTTPGILFKKILSSQWVFIVIGGMAITFITLRLSHRVAGPFFRFEKAFDEMISHDISNKIILRQKDEGKALAEKINRFNNALSEQLIRIDDQNLEIGSSLAKIETILLQRKDDALPDKDFGKILRLIEIIKANRKSIEAEVKKYTVNPSHKL